MEHVQAQEELQAYLDGALPPEQAGAVRAHLEECGACRAELALLRAVDETLRAWPVLPGPEGLAARIMGRVELEPASRRAVQARAGALWKAPWPWLRAHWSEALLGAALLATFVVLAVSTRALAGAVDLRFWDLSLQRSLAAVERAWYAAQRADAGRGLWAMGGRAGGAAQVYCWVAGAVALAAAAASAGVLAQQWRRLRGTPRQV